MIKLCYNILLITLAFCLFACEEIYKDFDADKHMPNIVIEGLITDKKPPHYIKISETVKFGDSITGIFVTGAEVILSDNEGNTEILTMEKPGFYRSDNVIGKPGNEYELTVKNRNIIYSSVCKMPSTFIVDSLVSNYRKKDILYNEGYYVTIFGKKPQTDSINYYKCNVYQNGHLITNRQYSLIISDDYSSLKQEYDFDEVFQSGDTVDIEVYSITKEVFYYFLDVNELIYSDVTVFGYQKNPRSNVSNGALGYFQVSACKKARIIIK